MLFIGDKTDYMTDWHEPQQLQVGWLEMQLLELEPTVGLKTRKQKTKQRSTERTRSCICHNEEKMWKLLTLFACAYQLYMSDYFIICCDRDKGDET